MGYVPTPAHETKHGHGLDHSHVEAVLAEDPLQADYRKWRMSQKYTAQQVTTYVLIAVLATYIFTCWLVKVGN